MIQALLLPARLFYKVFGAAAMRALDDYVSLGDLVINPFARLTAALNPAAAGLMLVTGTTAAVVFARKLAGPRPTSY